MIESVHMITRPQYARRNIINAAKPAARRFTVTAPPEGEMIFESGARTLMEDMLILAEAAAEREARVAPSYGGVITEFEDDETPFLGEFIRGMHPPGERVDGNV